MMWTTIGLTGRISGAVFSGALLAGLLATPTPVVAQDDDRPTNHRFARDDMPPGAVGRQRLMRRGANSDPYQPVRVLAPNKATVSFAVDSGFSSSQGSNAVAGMLIGEVYRLKISNIDQHPEEEVFPSIEVIDRLCPPPGMEAKFAIPIEITQDDLEDALDGKFVLRVIYLEDPEYSPPIQDKPGRQRVLDARPNEDALELADRFGRPMAILRIGSRVPDQDATGRFNFGSPPATILMPESTLPSSSSSGLEEPPVLPAPEGRPLGEPTALRPRFPRLPVTPLPTRR